MPGGRPMPSPARRSRSRHAVSVGSTSAQRASDRSLGYGLRGGMPRRSPLAQRHGSGNPRGEGFLG